MRGFPLVGFSPHLSGREGNCDCYTRISNVGSPSFTASIFYREKTGGRVALGFDLGYVHQTFDASYGSYSHFGGTSSAVHADLDLLYFATIPEVRLDATGNIVARFGVLLGAPVGGTALELTEYHPLGSSSSKRADQIEDFGLEIRFVVGLGFRVPLGSRWGVVVDPYGGMAINSMLFGGAGMKSMDLGLRLGISRRFLGRSFGQWLDTINPKPKPGDIW